MTPTHKDLVEALREAKRAMQKVKTDINECWPVGACYTTSASFILGSALSKINPILKELEAQ